MDQHPDTQIFVSGQTAEVFGRRIPGEGTTGDIISEWQYPLHSGKAFGLAGRVLICLIRYRRNCTFNHRGNYLGKKASPPFESHLTL